MSASQSHLAMNIMNNLTQLSKHQRSATQCDPHTLPPTRPWSPSEPRSSRYISPEPEWNVQLQYERCMEALIETSVGSDIYKDTVSVRYFDCCSFLKAETLELEWGNTRILLMSSKVPKTLPGLQQKQMPH